MKISRTGLWSALKMMLIVSTIIALIIPSQVMANEQNIQVTLKAGKSYEIKNSSTDKNVRINSDRNSQKKFDLATRGADGHVQSISRDYSSRSFTVDRTTSVIVTVYEQSDLEISYPAEFSQLLSVQEVGTPAAAVMTLQAGKSYEIYNSSTVKNIEIKSNRDSVRKYDLAFRAADGHIHSVSRDYSSKNFTINRATAVIVTVHQQSNLEIWYPAEWNNQIISIKEVGTSAASVMTLQAGKSYEIKNNSTVKNLEIRSNRDSLRKYDLASRASDGHVFSVSRDYSSKNFTINRAAAVIVTIHPQSDLEIWYPAEWNNQIISINEVEVPAASVMTLKAGKSYEIENSSTVRNLEIRSNRDSLKKYDLAFRNVDGYVNSVSRDYSSRSFSINRASAVIITVHPQSDLEIWYPGEWNNQLITIKEVEAPAAAVFTLKAGKSYEFKNSSTSRALEIKTNRDSLRKYGLAQLDGDGKVKSERIDYSNKNFTITRSSSVQISVHEQSDLEVWMPYEWTETLLAIKDLQSGKYLAKPSVNVVEENELLTTTEYQYDEWDQGESITLPIEQLQQITNNESAKKIVGDVIEELTDEQKASATGVDKITLFAEEAVSRAATQQIDQSEIIINKSLVEELSAAAVSAKQTVEQQLKQQGIEQQRDLRAVIRLDVNDASKPVTISVDSSIGQTKAELIHITAGSAQVAIPVSAIGEDLKGSEPLKITLEEVGAASSSGEVAVSALASTLPLAASALTSGSTSRSYKVTFNRPSLQETVKLSLPPVSGDPTYQTVMTADGNPIASKYNPATGLIVASINSGGTYTVKQNVKDFSDIQKKPQEMQEAIRYLASKGIINGTTDTKFSPDGSISRAEIAALVVRALGKLDANANGGFKDVTRSQWYYGAVGSAKKFGIINGYSDNTFKGSVTIPKIQIVAIAARTLEKEMGYRKPSNTSNYLKYSDNSSIADWAKADIAMATRENLIVKRIDNKFKPNDNMTRGDAAIILKRMFDKIW